MRAALKLGGERNSLFGVITLCVAVAAAVIGCQGGGSDAEAAAPSGSAAGIALAKRVNAYYLDAPRRAVAMRVPVPPGFASIQWGLVKGATEVLVARVTAAGETEITIGSHGRYFAREAGESCWRSTGAPEGLIGGPTIVLNGSTFSTPTREGNLTRLPVQEFDPGTGETNLSIYRVDAESGRIVTARQEGLTMTVRTLATFPTLPAVSPMCSQVSAGAPAVPAAPVR
ncbi:MAG: hypothetical protein QOD86_149 [Miltoncostaeaceae bacterium]|nr:hypothetical protein [Miltoncostaeaceae bacterium]